MNNFQNQLQGLEMTPYQAGELMPLDPYSEEARQYEMFGGGGSRCGGSHRCGGFSCFRCFNCFNCFSCFRCFNCSNCFRCHNCFRCWG
ncbi:heterocycloanthracin/sonorensin family bacteriocin [Fredinandcohnia quinoae]|uniref:Heterocycloanthracin/sonorensin family bacteriocin n=1 Tax=Fredinandcohnia quinoae TaxID=2918902 RepID=A0AAW5EDG0_9BACI|nr:heterocycloanthracin/sonorensin family bacteriocin [Fredinandcohnia sp. SECRCQ15]MCH1627183.1 heterocycloanthracin/sonorensin family bacteriocin [Fredinandcohnia sp. SECRCQ15]